MINIPSGVWSKYYEVTDYLINDNHIGKSCTVFYPPIKESCVNCNINHFGGVSTNVYKHGGPAPFHGACPLCGNNGYRETESTDTLRLRIYHSRKNWLKVNNIVIPQADVQVIGFSSDLPKLLRANEIELINEQNFIKQRYQLAAEPFLHGFGHSRYFVAFLQRI
jgi:hypothetical protein